MGLTGAKPLQRLLCQIKHMYHHFYGLQDSPFALTPDPTYLFLSASHKEALASMIYGVHERKGFVLIVGEVGTGKTTLIRHLLGQSTAQIKTAFIYNVVPIRWVLIRDPQEQFATQALLSTKLAATPQQILAWCVRRWRIKVTCEEARAHLGMETQRQWSEKAIAARRPACWGCTRCQPHGCSKSSRCPHTARHGTPNSADRLGHACVCAALRLWSQQHFQRSNTESDVIKVPRALFERLTESSAMLRKWIKSS